VTGYIEVVENSGDVNPRDVNSRDVNSGDVNSGDVNSGDVNSRDVNSGDVNSSDFYVNKINFPCPFPHFLINYSVNLYDQIMIEHNGNCK